jgi:tetratricopeptide (TPR) repeat protein
VINLAIALLAAAATLLVLAGAVHLGLWVSLLPSVVVLAGVYYWRTRVVLAKVKGMMDGMQKDLQAGRIDKAVETLKGAFPLASQQFMLASQLHSALGVLLYGKKDFDAALPHLQRAFFRDWQAQTTLGALYYKREEYDEMEKAFEKAVSAGKNQPLAWSVYAWCLNKAGMREKAQEVLSRAVEANAGDDRLKSNLSALQNDKRMKMQAYEPEWFQFHLERLPVEMTGGRRVQWQRR